MSIATRRDFLFGGAAAAGAFCWRMPVLAGRGKAGRSYSVPVLGDIHFDSTDPKFYHAAYTHSTSKNRYRSHLAEHVRNAEMWKDRMPRLVRSSAKCVRPDAVFALQMGDLVQGDCGNPVMHRRILDDVFTFVKGVYGEKLPFVAVAGNHDIRGAMKGDGARGVLEKWLPEKMSKELRVPVGGTTFSFRQGPDVFIVVDFNDPNPDFPRLKRLIEDSDGARYTFVVSHGPVIPNGYSRWFLYGKKKQDAKRRELRSLLAKRNAIVLSGHTHSLELYDCMFPEGRITQFVFNSVWSNPDLDKLKIHWDGAAAFGTPVIDSTAKVFKGLVAEYRPFVRECFFAGIAGHYTLNVSDDQVAVEVYPGDATVPVRTFRLR